MAAGNAISILTLVVFFYCSVVLGDQLQTKIYKKFKSFFPCVLLTNATHSIGCTSSMNGNVGVLHLITKKEHLDWLIRDGPHEPYVPLISSDMFTRSTMDRLVNSKKINGALVISVGHLGGAPISGFSPDPSCPLDDFGMYSKSKNYSSCKKVEWNDQGNSMSMVFYDLPIFALGSEEEINETINCIEKHNSPSKGNSVPEYPLCAVELKDFMFAARDTPTCKRKSDVPLSQVSFCDPLGDWNVWSTLYPLPRQVPKKEVIFITSKMDSSGFFHDLAPGANNDVSGIVTLLGAAYALGQLKRDIDAGKVVGHKMKPIMFVLFNGEIWDYVGSSRMVWDMENGRFPHADSSGNSDLVPKMDLSNIGHFIELSQVGQMMNRNLWLHSDPVSTGKDPDVKKEVEQMESYFKNASKSANIGIKIADRSMPLPPASFQRFLRSKKLTKKIPGIVLADHEKQFNNKYYNSRYDNVDNIGVRFEILNKTHFSSRKNESEEFATLASIVATVAYKLATGGEEPPTKLEVSPEQIAQLIYCLLISASCPVFREILPISKSSNPLPRKPYSRYVSVAQLTNPITDILYSILGYYTGTLTEYKAETCPEKRFDLPSSAFSTFGIKGPVVNKTGICVNASVHKTAAVSPAFEIKDYHSTEFSTWAESMWNADFGVRMFLVPGPTMEYATLGCGILVLLLSFVVVHIIYKRSELIFTPSIGYENHEDDIQQIVN